MIRFGQSTIKKLWIIGLCALAALMMTACGAWDEESEENWDEEWNQEWEDEESSWESDDMEAEQGSGSIDESIASQSFEIYAQQRDVWVGDISFNDSYLYTLADLTNNGKLTLIVSQFGGTGFYTYSRFFQIDETGNVVELTTSFTEFDSQPDIMNEGEITAYYDAASPQGPYFYVVHDELKVSPASYAYETGALSIEGDAVTYTRLATQEVEYVGEDQLASITSEDFEGNPLTEEEYESFADSYYSELGYSKDVYYLEWAEVVDIADMSEEEAVAELARVSGMN